MLFTLAETIGGYTVDQLGEIMSVSEMTEWKEYFRLKEVERKKQKNKK